MPRALIIEDDIHVRELVARHLANVGWSSIEVGRVGDALEILDEAIDLVVLDLRLPNGHGLQILRAIAATRDDVPVIVLTGWPEDLGELARAAPIVEVLTKPFQAWAFYEAVTRAGRSRASIESIRSSTSRLERMLKGQGGEMGGIA
jgi:DNA-binding NtrC family response regulator